jgi:hypothetical protein
MCALISLSSPYGPSGYLVVGAAAEPAHEQKLLLGVVAQQAGAALASGRRQREQALALRSARDELRRSREIRDRLTGVALGSEGEGGLARAVYELTGRAAAVEDRFGNLRAWAGPGRPDPYPRCDPDRRARLLDQAGAGMVRDGARLVSVARLGAAPVAVLDPDGTAGDARGAGGG